MGCDGEARVLSGGAGPLCSDSSLVRSIKGKFDTGAFDDLSPTRVTRRDSLEAELRVIRSGHAKGSVEYFESEIIKHTRSNSSQAGCDGNTLDSESVRGEKAIPASPGGWSRLSHNSGTCASINPRECRNFTGDELQYADDESQPTDDESKMLKTPVEAGIVDPDPLPAKFETVMLDSSPLAQQPLEDESKAIAIDDSEPKVNGIKCAISDSLPEVSAVDTEGDTPEVAANHPIVAIVPLNGQFETFVIELDHAYRFGRNNSSLFPEKYYCTFSSQVVSRNHLEIFTLENRICVQDIGSSSGTFVNGVRTSEPHKTSKVFEVREGDIIQMGKDWSPSRCSNPPQTEITPEVLSQRKCVRFGIAILKPNSRGRIDYSSLKVLESSSAASAVPEEEKIPEDGSPPAPGADIISKDESPQTAECLADQSQIHDALQADADVDPDDIHTSDFHRFVVLANYFGDRVKKITLLNEHGSEFVDVSLKEWQSSRVILLAAKSSANASLYSLKVLPEGSSFQMLSHFPSKFIITTELDETLASLEFVNKMKLQLIPKVTSDDDVSHFTVIGDFDRGRYMIVERFKSSRKQVSVGGSSLSKSARTRLVEFQKISQVSIKCTSYFRIIFGAVILLYCVRFPS